MTGTELIRAPLFHTRADPFRDPRAFVCHQDGGLFLKEGRIAASGPFEEVRLLARDAAVTDWRGGMVVPGFVDAHVHFPQTQIIGAFGRSLLDWLEQTALPEEARMSDLTHAAATAQHFVTALAANGTTTALVFGAHFAAATAVLFEAAATAGLRVISGLVVSDRALRPDLHQTVEAAYRDSTNLIQRFHNRGRTLYAVTPRFALSTSDAMLEMCQTLAAEHPSVRVQSHVNENQEEIAAVRRSFPWATDYLHVYERYGLTGSRTVLAHNVHPTDRELEGLAASDTSVAHCPASNAALGSGIFSLWRHARAGVHVSLGTDVGGGTGFGMPKEALFAHLVQRVAPNPVTIDTPSMLYLATLAGAEALGLDRDIGSLCAGKAADFVYLRPPAGSAFEAAWTRADSPQHALGVLFAMAGSDSVCEVRVEGARIHPA